MADAEKGKNLRLENVKNIVTSHEAELKALGVKTLGVFGSVARGDAGPNSDVDLLVEFDQPFGMFQFIHVNNFLKDLLAGVEVDLVAKDAVYEELRDDIYGEAVDVL